MNQPINKEIADQARNDAQIRAELAVEKEQIIVDKETLILSSINLGHDVFSGLVMTHPNDLADWVVHIHALQRIIATRIVRRDHPELFATYVEKKKRRTKP